MPELIDKKRTEAKVFLKVNGSHKGADRCFEKRGVDD